MQTWWSSALLVALGALLTAGTSYFTGSAQFRRQQEVEQQRWVREQRLAAYRLLTQVLRRADELEMDALYYHPEHWRGVSRKGGPVPLEAAIGGVRLVGSDEVNRRLDELDRISWEANNNGMDGELARELVGVVRRVEDAMSWDLREGA